MRETISFRTTPCINTSSTLCIKFLEYSCPIVEIGIGGAREKLPDKPQSGTRIMTFIYDAGMYLPGD
jgi:hypothetical protein